MAGVLCNFTLAAAAGVNDEAADFTIDEEKAFATSNTPAPDSMSVSAIDACAIIGRETGCGDRTFTLTQLPIQASGLREIYNGDIFRSRMNAPDRAPRRMPRLTRPPSPEADWLAAQGHALMKSNDPAKAEAMERGAGISRKPKHAYQADPPRPVLQ